MLLPLPAGHPTLPLKRARVDGQRAERERRVCGAAGLVQLGSSRAALVSGGAVLFGTFSSYTQPWFQIDLDCGGKHNCRAHEALAALLFDPADFVGRPDLFYYDFNVGNPSLVPGWTKGLVDYLDRFDALVPMSWLDPDDAAAGSFGGSAAGAVSAAIPAAADAAYIERERVRLRQAWVDLAGSAWSPATLSNLRNPALKAL